jgi:hypothetical protein
MSDISIADMTEFDMRDADAPTPNTLDELNDYITSLTEKKHDYGTSAYAVSLAATATFNYMARMLGITGFQAGCADLDIIRRTRNMDCPFAIFSANDMLYPQYDLPKKLQDLLMQWTPWAAEQAKRLYDERDEFVHPDVLERWKKLAESTKAKGGTK